MMQKAYTENDDWLDVSDDGKVYHHGYEMKQQTYKLGYKYVQNNGHNYLVHRLVASAFIQPLRRGDRSLQVHHKNGDKSDNRVENLEILTVQEHQHHHKQIYPITKICEVCGKEYTPHKTKRKRSKTCSKECWREICRIKQQRVKVVQFDKDGNFIKIWDSMSDPCREYGWFTSNINKCCRGIIQTYKGYRWKYWNDMTDAERYEIIKPGE